jgi:RNA polymerase-interacting CarD/CdnL/TRCF family regulator
MLDIKLENNEFVMRIPKVLISDVYLRKLIERLELELKVKKIKMTEEQAWEISEEIKSDWWSDIKKRSSGMQKQMKKKSLKSCIKY